MRLRLFSRLPRVSSSTLAAMPRRAYAGSSADAPIDEAPVSRFASFMELGKPRLSALVVLTTMFGYSVAPGPFEMASFFGASVGTAALAVSAGAFNQYIERDLDAKMIRTRARPLPSGRLMPREALQFAVGTSAVGVAVLAVTCPIESVVLGALNTALYAGVYTPLKQRHELNTPVGAIVGAIPPAIGWTAACGTGGLGMWALMGLLYAWQMPHFHSLSYNLMEDYRRGGYRMLVLQPGNALGRSVLVHAAALVPLGAVFALAGVTDWSFAVTSLVPSLWFLGLVVSFVREQNHANARKVFLGSVKFLPLYLVLLLCHNLYQRHKDGSIKESIGPAPDVLCETSEVKLKQ